MSSSLWSISSMGTSLGLLLLLHAAFSCWHYRTTLLILLEEADEITAAAASSNSAASGAPSAVAATNATTDWQRPPPMDVIWELVVAFLLCLVTQIQPSTLRPVGLSSSKTKTTTGITKRTRAPLYQTREFDLYATRAKALAAATATAIKPKIN